MTLLESETTNTPCQLKDLNLGCRSVSTCLEQVSPSWSVPEALSTELVEVTLAEKSRCKPVR